MKIKVVVFNHNQKTSAEKLFSDLSNEFDIALFDSGSNQDETSELSTHIFPNIYWTGCWNKAWELFPDSDLIWGIGGDCAVTAEPRQYRKAIESAPPFGIWSPRIEGKRLPYMQVDEGTVLSVKLIEGIAFALTEKLWKLIGGFDKSNYIGWGQDCIASFLSQENGMHNLLDGRVSLTHPPSTQYDRVLADILQQAVVLRVLGKERGHALLYAMDAHYASPHLNLICSLDLAQEP